MQYIAFQNNAGREHTNPRCGTSRNNHVHNFPYITAEITNPCGRCSSTSEYREANAENIEWACTYTERIARRSQYGVSSGFHSYVEEVKAEMMNSVR